MRAARWLLIPVLAIPLAWVLFTGLGDRARSLAAGRAADARFALTTLDGRALSSADLAGQPVVINFWASWCIPACVDEHPVLLDTQAQHGDEVQLVGILYHDDPRDAREFLVRYGDGGWPNATTRPARSPSPTACSGRPRRSSWTRTGSSRPSTTGPDRGRRGGQRR